MAPMNRWTRLLGPFRPKAARRPRGSAPSSDFADYGTAFGLDLSLSPAALAKDPPRSPPPQEAAAGLAKAQKPR